MSRLVSPMSVTTSGDRGPRASRTAAATRAGAPVAAPVSWTELRDLDTAARWSVRDAAALIERANGRGLAGWGVADQVLPDL